MSAPDQTLHTTHRTGILLLVVFFVGFLSIGGISLVYERLNAELEAKLANERAHLFIGEQIVNTIGTAERLFFQMAQADNDAMYRRLERDIHATADQLQEYLRVLEHGGLVRQSRALNLYGVDEMVREVVYQPQIDKTQPTVMTLIEIGPFVDRIRDNVQELDTLLRRRDECLERELNCIRDVTAELRLYYKQLPSFFFRLGENANRQFYEAVGVMRDLEQQSAWQVQMLQRTRVVLVLVVVLVVMGLGVYLIRRINQTQHALALARARAEEANLAKSRFLATMSHEIRTPMNGILGMAQILENQDQDEAERRYCLKVLRESGRSLLTLLNDILDLSRVEAGKLELRLVDVSPVELAYEVTALFKETAQIKGLDLRVESDLPMHERFMVDPVRLRQMLTNLVSNAVKFTAQGGVRLELHRVDGDGGAPLLEFAVVDSGIGIAPGQLQRLFQSFTQIDDSTTRAFGGSGLGLSIVRHLAVLMEGQVGVHSTPGQGSRFWFRIPARSATQAATAAGDLPLVAVDTEETRPPLAGTVLVVEYTLPNRLMLKMALTRMGVTVRTTENGAQAVEALQAGPGVDVVLMDLRMPVMDGLAATRAIRAWEQAEGRERCPIVACTANAYEEDRRTCAEAGMDHFLVKPIAYHELYQVLQRWLPMAPAASAPRGGASRDLPDVLPEGDRATFVALCDKLEPLLADHLFDAMAVCRELVEAVRGTAQEPAVQAINRQVSALDFDGALAALQQWRQALSSRASRP